MSDKETQERCKVCNSEIYNGKCVGCEPVSSIEKPIKKLGHRSELDWCCACEYDIAVMESIIKNSLSSLISEIEKMRKENKPIKYEPSILGGVLIDNEPDKKWNSAINSVIAKIKERMQ